MPFTYASRTGSTYYLHSGPKRGGGLQHYFSTKSKGNLVERLPEGFEIYETVNGQVYLRRHRPKLIRDDERDCIALPLQKLTQGPRYRIEIQGDTLTVHESAADFSGIRRYLPAISEAGFQAGLESVRHYQLVLRFILVDPVRRQFAPERFCFRGSVDDWISIGPRESIDKLAKQYLKHLGKDSMFELY